MGEVIFDRLMDVFYEMVKDAGVADLVAGNENMALYFLFFASAWEMSENRFIEEFNSQDLTCDCGKCLQLKVRYEEV